MQNTFNVFVCSLAENKLAMAKPVFNDSIGHLSQGSMNGHDVNFTQQ